MSVLDSQIHHPLLSALLKSLVTPFGSRAPEGRKGSLNISFWWNSPRRQADCGAVPAPISYPILSTSRNLFLLLIHRVFYRDGITQEYGNKLNELLQANRTILWNVMPCSLVEVSRRFGRTHCLHFQGRKICQEITPIRDLPRSYRLLV